MILHWNHWLVGLFLKLPRWIGHIEAVRVGDDYDTHCKITWRAK